MDVFKVLGQGFAILFGAILINIIVKAFKGTTWFDYFTLIQQNGFITASKMAGFWLIFLYLIYPVLLGLIAYATNFK